jgi:hypothetical protein
MNSPLGSFATAYLPRLFDQMCHTLSIVLNLNGVSV